jgi:N-formylglutamate amidohydrolase
MFQLDHPEQNEIFSYYSPQDKFIGIVSIPHSGEIIPDDMEDYLVAGKRDCQEDVDFKVNELVDIETLQKNGIAVIVSHIHRVCVDLNRDMANTIFYWKKNTQGVDLVTKEVGAAKKEEFRLKYYQPYYEMLKSLITELEKHQTTASFVDLHSMPSKPTEYHLSKNPDQETHRAEFCVSDRHGLTCHPDFINHVCDELKSYGRDVAINNPYVGGYITEWVNGFKTNNIQIEINRSIYMDEKEKVLIPDLASKLKDELTPSLVSLFQKFEKN